MDVRFLRLNGPIAPELLTSALWQAPEPKIAVLSGIAATTCSCALISRAYFCDAEGAIAIRLRPGWKRKGRQAHHTGCSMGVLRPSRLSGLTRCNGDGFVN